MIQSLHLERLTRRPNWQNRAVILSKTRSRAQGFPTRTPSSRYPTPAVRLPRNSALSLSRVGRTGKRSLGREDRLAECPVRIRSTSIGMVFTLWTRLALRSLKKSLHRRKHLEKAGHLKVKLSPPSKTAGKVSFSPSRRALFRNFFRAAGRELK